MTRPVAGPARAGSWGGRGGGATVGSTRAAGEKGGGGRLVGAPPALSLPSPNPPVETARNRKTQSSGSFCRRPRAQALRERVGRGRGSRDDSGPFEAGTYCHASR